MTSETTTSESSGNTTPSLNFRARAFQFTMNDPSHYNEFRDIFKGLKSCDYFISCKELAPTTNHEHIHVYAHFTSNYRLSQKILKFNTHVELCKGSPQQNIEYIRKDGNILDEWGDEPHQGFHKVADLKAIDNPDQLNWNEYNTWVRIHNAPQKVKVTEWRKDVKVYYIWGPSGIGKSNKIQELLVQEGIEEFEELKHIGEFWHGVIDGKGTCVYDDWRDSHMTASEFINFIDYRVHSLNIKGGSVKNNYTKIFISTVQDPNEIYRNLQGEPREQWMRRITIIDMNTPNLSDAL